MKEGSMEAGSGYRTRRDSPPIVPLTAPITAGLLSWAVISAGFFGLKLLMQERPEFVGQPMLVTSAELIQEAPRVALRRISDDVSVIQASQPELSDVRFDLNGRRDYRGLRTIRDMSGHFQGRYVLTNGFDEPSYILFKCPHPRTENGGNDALVAGELKLRTAAPGMQENTPDAWYWSGTLQPHGTAALEVSYDVTSLKGVTYRVTGQDGNQVKQLRVTLNRQDLAAMRIDSGDGTKRPADGPIGWERRDFLAPDFFSATIEEGRSLFGSISQLLEIGPLICLLFLVAVSAVLLARQELTAFQMFTIAAGYAVYFPLMLYLAANISFHWALILAVVVPGVLLANYARWLVGGKVGVLGAIVFLALYQVFPTLAAFAGWNRGMVLLCLGVVTLAVLINLQNRTLKLRAATALGLMTLLLSALSLNAAEVQVILPAELATRAPDAKRELTNSPLALVAFQPAEYKVKHEATHFRIEATASLEAIRAGETPIPLFNAPVYLEQAKIEPEQSARLVTLTNRLALFVQRAGSGSLRLSYRVPAINREGKWHAQIPLLLGAPGNLRLESPLDVIEVVGGSVWTKATADNATTYDIGVAGEESLGLEWREGVSRAGTAQPQAESAKDFYGIGLARAQNLTIINSDGSCTHFAEYEVPVSQSPEFRLRLPPAARLLSASVNHIEIVSPRVQDQVCIIRLPSRAAQQTAHLVSFRFAYPPAPLGFSGIAELALPELFQTAGLLEWAVALPTGFEARVLSCGLETQKSPPDLERFGDYGRILKQRVNINLAKDLAPPGLVKLSLKYRQTVPGMFAAGSQTNTLPGSN